LQKHLRIKARISQLSKKSAAALDQALALGAAEVPDPITVIVPDKETGAKVTRQVRVDDNFAGGNACFRSKVFNRFEVVEVREPSERSQRMAAKKAAKAAAGPQVANTAEAGA
jgi:hypothetical protein